MDEANREASKLCMKVLVGCVRLVAYGRISERGDR
jgi:hypothetical protein